MHNYELYGCVTNTGMEWASVVWVCHELERGWKGRELYECVTNTGWGWVQLYGYVTNTGEEGAPVVMNT